jgi:putative acetyltransferase
VAFGLGPMAVAPELQRSGIGSELVAAGFLACEAHGVGLVFVLGHPSYYPRFGFEPAAGRGFRYRSAAFDRAFFLRELVPGAAQGGGGLVRFAAPFEAV